ncbi:flagellar protein FliJ [Lachnospiraceae bacterium KM106-2]|nr:flagellar protein FliJ [Lachnospiraceae bacterium KM106-2]
MGKFNFRLENILQIKYKLEDEAKNAYGSAKHKLDEEQDKLTKLQQRKDHYQAMLCGQVKSKLVVREIISCENAVETMKYKMRVQQVVVNQHIQLVENARIKMNDAVIERKTYEKLREKEFEKFVKEMAMKEAKEIDELVSYKFNQTSEDV